MPNSSNAYATVRPIQSNIGDTIRGIEEMDFAYRKEQRDIEAQRKAEQEKQDEKKKALISEYKINLPNSTGISSMDQANIEFIKKTMTALEPIFEKERTGQELTTEEIIKKQNLLKMPEKLSLMSKAYQEENNRYYDFLKKGNHPDFNYEKKISKLQENAVLFLDDKGEPIIGIDNDNDGEPDFLYQDYEGLTIKPNYLEKIDYETAIKNASENLSVERTVNDTGFVKKTNEFLPLDVAKSKAKTMVYNQDGTLSNFTKSQFFPLSENEITKEALLEFENKTSTDILNSKKKINEKDVDAGAILANKKYNDETKVDKIQAKFDSTLRKDQFTGTQISSDAVYENMIAFADNKLKFKNLGGKSSGLNNGYVTGFALQKDGTVIATGKALVDKGKRFKIGGGTMNVEEMVKAANEGNQEAQLALDSYATADNYGTFTRILSGPETSGMAKQAGYNSVDELKTELKQMNNATKPKVNY